MLQGRLLVISLQILSYYNVIVTSNKSVLLFPHSVIYAKVFTFAKLHKKDTEKELLMRRNKVRGSLCLGNNLRFK